MDSTTATMNQEAIEAYAAGDRQAAISLWRAALSASSDSWEIMAYLGSALKEEGQLEQAAGYYEQALSLEPRLAEVHYNLGNIRQTEGRLKDAANAYKEALSLKPDFGYAWYNLGNVFRDTGKLNAAVDCYKQSILCNPRHAPSFNNLGNALKHQGDLDQAIQCYRAALDNQPDYGDAMYNLGNLYFEQADFPRALPWFQRAQTRDSEARALYCQYKTKQHEAFAGQLESLLAGAPHHSPQVATLAAHSAINRGGENRYRFCPEPFAMVHHAPLAELAGDTAPLREALLGDIRGADLEERTQGRLHEGVQSAGHLFQREEASFRQLAELLVRELNQYRERFADADCELISAFPEQIRFESAWYIRMQQGGFLDAHIHEGGWVSGVVYLSLPERGNSGEEGCFELSLHGDDYPVEPGVEFPAQVLDIRVGDLVLFPANLFHRTLPFSDSAERICIAFDLMPAGGVR